MKIMRAARGRPARVVWSFIALALVLPACAERGSNSDATAPVAVTERGVEIRDLARDDTRRTVAATVVEHGIERRLTLAPLPDGPSPGLVATIEDDGSFFELSFAANEHTGELWIRERTAVDEMTIVLREHDGRMFESYDINGDRLAFDRPVLPAVQMEKALARYRAGDIDDAATSELWEIGDAFAAFDAFYTPTMTNTLHHNEAGDLLMGLLQDPVVAGVVIGDDPTPNRKDGLSSRFCWVITACAGIKCLFGGLANPACAACASGAVGCAIMELYCWWAGCGCCY